MPRHTTGNRVNGKAHLDALLLQQLHKLVQLMLRLSHRQTVTRHDDHLACVVHGNGRIGSISRLHGALNLAIGTVVFATKVAEDDVADLAVHRFGHHQRQQRACRAHYRTGNDHRRVLQHKTFKGNSQAGECVVQGDDHRHIGATNRRGEQYTQRQSDGKEHQNQEHWRFRCAGNRHHTDDRTNEQRTTQQGRVDVLVLGQAPGLVHATIKLGPGDQ